MAPAAGPSRWLAEAGRRLVELLYPARCAGCGASGSLLCAACIRRFAPLPSPCCDRCGRPLSRQGLCADCRARPSPLDCVLSAGVYSPPLSDAIQKFKYGGVAALGEPLAPSLAAMWRARGLGAELIVPVPLHPLRERARGYNQSVLLAQQLGRLVGVPVEHRLVLRSRHTRPQVGLNPELRRANVAGAFLAHGTAVGLHVLVVDDVCTTGATLEACASALVEAGAQRVTGLTLARALWNGQGWSDGPAADAPA